MELLRWRFSIISCLLPIMFSIKLSFFSLLMHKKYRLQGNKTTFSLFFRVTSLDEVPS